MSYKHTTIQTNVQHFQALRTMAARCLDSLEWRRHGIGMIQAYLREGRYFETRLHIWHPSIVRSGIPGHGDIHDHRFDLESVVLEGRIFHTEVELTPDEKGEYQLYTCVHAREDLGARYRVVGEHDDRFSIQTYTDRIAAGESYTFRRGEFHYSYIDDLAVTVVTKRRQIETPARILAKVEGDIVHAFEEGDDFDMSEVLSMAKDKLLGHSVDWG